MTHEYPDIFAQSIWERAQLWDFTMLFDVSLAEKQIKIFVNLLENGSRPIKEERGHD
jgi:hypothetical protein